MPGPVPRERSTRSQLWPNAANVRNARIGDTPSAAPASLRIQAILKAGSALMRFHSKSRAGNIYNPNTGKRIEIEEEGARFNPFPGAPAANVPTLYAADNITAA